VADAARTVDKALEMAEVVLSMPQPTVRMIKEAVNATANALHGASAFADADQSQLTASSKSARGARESFRRNRKIAMSVRSVRHAHCGKGAAQELANVA
jgi:1,4-dihydroxy-2-naphthoyl-CoA synthase